MEMESSFFISPSFRALGIPLKAPTRERDWCILRSKRSAVCCQANAGQKAVHSIEVSSGRSALFSEDHSSSAVIKAGSMVLSPNRKGHPEVVKEIAPCSAPTASLPVVDVQDGIGIVRFVRGKVLFITGATGFLAKVLIEKILRTMPDIGKIYVLIKAKNKEAAMGRLENEIINSDLFKYLRQTYGKSYRSFMLSKLVPIVGNVCETNLGVEEESANEIVGEIDVIVNSAANTTFDERYDVAVEINTRGPGHLMGFARKCKNLKLFLQVSTAYVNGQREGRVLEKPFSIGDCITSENFNHGSKTRILSTLDVEYEMNLALESQKVFEENEIGQKLKKLGLKRAKKYGWQDTYVFTKAMGEMMIDSLRGDIPVVIIRPSVIESTWKDPFPGWIEGNRMMDPIILYYGKGQLTGFLVDPNGVLDVVPADMVVNATLAAMAKHGNAKKSGVNVYQVASSAVNPLVFKELADMLYQHYNSDPHIDSKGRPIAVSSMKLFNSMEDFSSNMCIDVINRIRLSDIASVNGKLSWKHELLCKKSVEQAKHLASIYEPYSFYGGRFDNSNTRRLFESMSENEKMEFGFDVGSIDWRDYITNIHIPGLRRHVMKGRGMTG